MILASAAVRLVTFPFMITNSLATGPLLFHFFIEILRAK